MNTHEAAASEQHAFPIVGSGASAGGLEAIRDLIRSLPTNLGMAYVILQHLDPIHVSTLPALLSQATVMPVSEIAEHVVLQPDHVYIIPPNTTLTLERRVFKLHSRAGTGGHPICIKLRTAELWIAQLLEGTR